MTGTTKSGFNFDVDVAVLDNMELVDALAEAEEDGTKISKVIVMVLGKEQRKRLYDHLRNDAGVVSVESVSAEILDIFEQLGEAGKK